jgi:putative endonuclease
MDGRGELGKRGEELACAKLRRLGYRIVDRRFRTRCGEIDIVARDGNVLVFVEVKARSTRSFGHPLESLTWQKRHRLSRLAACYLFAKRMSEVACRFDVVAVTAAGSGRFRVEVVKSAFELS